MKAMFLAFLAAAVITVGADYGLDYAGFSAAERTTYGMDVRVGDAADDRRAAH
ncbi:hypothetical protein ACQ5SO_13660 [Rhodovulum sp. DZ06]|uniref:hypothetical protein n=1 Tax=Rhodovulum sp. DZ06 TaxID=3425126 RepID=UPI003D325061